MTKNIYLIRMLRIVVYVVVFAVFGGSARTFASGYYFSTSINGTGDNSSDEGRGIAKDSQGNIFIVGTIDNIGSGKDIFIGKFNSTLVLISSTSVNGSLNDEDYGAGIAVDNNGNAFIVGYVNKGLATSPDLWIAKYDSNLVLQSSKTFNGSANGYDAGRAITIDNSGNVIAVGEVTETLGGRNLWVGKFDSGLVLISSTTNIVSGGPGSASESFRSVATDATGNIFAVGYNDFSGSERILMMTFSPTLEILSNSAMLGESSSPDIAHGITRDSNDNFYVTGQLYQASSGNDLWIGKFHKVSSVNLFLTGTAAIINSSVNGSDIGYGITTDISGDVFATGIVQTGWAAKLSSPPVLISSFPSTGFCGYGAITYGSSLYVVGAKNAVWLSKFPLPGIPTGFSGSTLGISSITWSWNDAVGEDAYQVFSAAGDAVSPLLTSNTLSWTETGLNVNTTYSRYVKAINDIGASSSTFSAALTLASGPTTPTVFQGQALGISSITWSWNSSIGQDSYQVFSAADSAVSPLLNANTTTWTEIDLTANRTYTRYVKASNAFGSASSAPNSMTTAANTASVTQRLTSAGGTLIYRPIYGDVEVVIPPDSFSSDRVFTLKLPTSFASNNSPTIQLNGTGIGIEISLDQPTQPHNNVSITINYRDSDVSGLDESKLIIARYDPANEVWVPLGSTPDPTNNRVIGLTNHFSTFQLMHAIPPTSVADAKVFPNPFLPTQGHSYITFSNLPANTQIRLYTFSGERVKSLTTDSTGVVSWDAKNEFGEPIASGVLFAVLDGNGSTKRIKVAIQR